MSKYTRGIQLGKAAHMLTWGGWRETCGEVISVIILRSVHLPELRDRACESPGYPWPTEAKLNAEQT